MSDHHAAKPAASEPPTDPAAQRRSDVRKALERYAKKLTRRLDALRGDLEEAARAGDWRRYGEALLTYAHKVPARAKHVKLEDPSDPDSAFDIELDPKVSA